MKFTGKILFNETIHIEGEYLPIKKTEIFSKILENDIVEYEKDGIENKIIILKILKRKGVVTLAYIRSYNPLEKKVYFKLPFYNDTFSFFYSSDIIKESSVGSIYLVNINFLGLDILEYIGNIKNLYTVKNGINKILYCKNEELLKLYTNNLPKEDEKIVEYIDLKQLNTFNIDPEGTKDIDDAISLDLENNKIYVHIVDIHNQIKINSEEDLKYLNQSYTLYLPDKTYHCISKNITCDILSLKKDEERKTVTFEYKYNPETLEIISSKIFLASIINKNSYSYEDFDKKINENLNDNKELIFIKTFTEKWKMKSFTIPSIKFNIDKGYIKSLDRIYSNTMSHKFIETMMILSNCTYSSYIQEINPNFPKRNHPKTFDMKLINNIKFSDIEEIDNFMKIKKFKKAFYSLKDSGHFGLNLNYYTHFTSPIRRYIDVINHRIFNGCIYDEILLKEMISHVNEQDILLGRIYDWYYGIILQKYLKIESNKIYEAYVIKICKNGISFIIPSLMYNDYIHVSKINRENKSKWDFIHNEDEIQNKLVDQFNTIITIGNKISVKIESVSLFQISFITNL
jgi:ribonuclease R